MTKSQKAVDRQLWLFAVIGAMIVEITSGQGSKRKTPPAGGAFEAQQLFCNL